ncbi:MAG: aminoacyl-tRNA hydrolase [Spirochaetales bacterium]|nr:aminoacyl-tRNA hydrolase [Spirochaetales bacterium]
MKELQSPQQYQGPLDIKAIAFLGNPGTEYAATRHNAGWMFGHSLQWTELGPWQKKFKALYSSGVLEGQKIYLLYPQTYMNLSGESVRSFSDYFHLLAQDWLVVHDDIELEFGQVQLQKGGGLGGHNGLRSIVAHLGTKDFFRLRLGIGRPRQGDVASFVLGRFTSQELVSWPEILKRAFEIILASWRQTP